MQFLIHACPKRLWYVEEYLIPSLLAQGVDRGQIEIWNDTEKKGNLTACMESFAARTGDGGTWHLQDDVLLCSDFVERCRTLDHGLVYGFCNEQFRDDPGLCGEVYMPDAWHSFQCVRIPDAWARECAEWFYTDASQRPDMKGLAAVGNNDDWFFTEFLSERHGADGAYNARPCLVEHVDVLIGGSVVNQWRGFWARAHWFEDTDLVDALRKQLRARR